jgi:hypothetical protein
MTRRETPKCKGCGRRIPKHEPDLMLRRLDGEARRYYHERCIASAYAKVSASRPDAWVLTHRHVSAEAN